MMNNYYILMGDVIASRTIDSRELQRQLENLVSTCNRNLKSRILSPFTITLGDEFQGIVKSRRALVESIFFLEENRIKNQYHFKLRYVGHYGEIQTPINKKIAYGMMGPGLSKTRELLTNKQQERPRFIFDFSDQRLSNNLVRLCKVLANITNSWKTEDYAIISDMLINPNNEDVAAKFNKNRSQIWKRRKHLRIEDYKLIKDVLFDLIDSPE